MMSGNLSNIAILNIKDSDYWSIISLISKNEAVNLLQNADFTEHYKLKNIYEIFEIIYKNGKSNHKIWWYWNPKTKISST